MQIATPNIEKAVFRPRARVLQHLGDQLIGSPRLAVFELVKNAYDADATCVEVTIRGIGSTSRSILIEDDGVGMSLPVVQNIWLVIAHDHKDKKRQLRQRSELGRLPLGSKGLGRLSVHKLGNKIEMVTRSAEMQEVVVRIDWNAMIAKEYLEDAEFDIEVRQPLRFTGPSTGTSICINDLRSERWTRGEIRRLYRQITSISSPFGTRGYNGFSAILKVPEVPSWIENLPDPSEILKRAPWHYRFTFDGRTFSYKYMFNGIRGITREPREVVSKTEPLLVPQAEVDDDDPLFSGIPQRLTTQKIVADEEMLRGIGAISGELYVFDLSPRIMKQMGEMQFVKDFLTENGGVRVYRDGMRVYDYGERNNDWLGLDLQRLSKLAKGLSRNIVAGYISLDLDSSFDLVEKSNREGFIENSAYERLQRIALGAIEPLRRERERDRRALKRLLGGINDPETKSILEPLNKIRQIAKQNGIFDQVSVLLDRIEHEYVAMKERLLAAGISGTSLALVFHEIEQGIHSLHRNLEADRESTDVADLVKDLMRLLDGFSDLLRKRSRKPVDLKKLVKRACDLSSIRFRHHKVRLECPALNEIGSGPVILCSFGLTLGVLTNVIDNAIYWMRTRWSTEDDAGGRAIFVNIDGNFDSGPAVVVADTGPGFQDSPAELIRPFYSRRPDGMGMGLYYASMVMELNDGELIFPSCFEIDLPNEFDGAVVALRFPEMEA